MPLTTNEEKELIAEAERSGVDPQRLIAVAKQLADGNLAGPDQPKLFKYLLPFVTVKEVRSRWLGLTDGFPGDATVAAEWAVKHGGEAGGDDEPA